MYKLTKDEWHSDEATLFLFNLINFLLHLSHLYDNSGNAICKRPSKFWYL